ncbi:MAG: hypothetical protein V2I43_15485 [Parvularcula sp.]|nr:hypothetical protein [Parvularcula sp.]
MLKRFGAAVAVAALSLSCAQAFDWKESYRDYQSAMQSGDMSAAVDHAKAAWRGSKADLPPGENRALLAQNYVSLIYPANPPAAIEAL